MTTSLTPPELDAEPSVPATPSDTLDDSVPGIGFSPTAARTRRARLRRQLLGRLRYATISAVLTAIFLTLVVLASGGNATTVGNQLQAGFSLGAIAALSGVGLVLTYRATGVFNFAQGGVATVAAFVYYEIAGTSASPGIVVLAVLVAVVGVGPILGTSMELLVFRPLQRRQAGTSERLVANLGVLIVLLGICGVIYGSLSFAPAAIFPSYAAVTIGQVSIPWVTVGNVALVVLAGGSLAVLFGVTRLGRQIRAVVDRRGLAELNAVNANRVAVIAWSIGCTFAALTGVLYAPQGLQNGPLALTVLTTISVAVIAKIRSIPGAIGAGFGIGLVQSLGSILERPRYPGWLPLPGLNQNVVTEIFVIATLVFLLIYRRLDEVGAGNAASLVTGSFSAARKAGSHLRLGLPALGIALVILIGVSLGGDNLATATQVVCYSVAFLAIVAITGYSGHISLATASFAGIGAYVSTRLSNGYLPLPVSSHVPHIPVLIAMLIGGLVCVPLGVIIGYPALRRRGLILGLLTLGFAQVVDALVFEQESWVNGGTTVHRPKLGPLDFNGNQAFFFFALVILGLALLLVRNLRSGSLGRVLGAMRDSENGAVSVGISLRRYKLFIFGASSFIAGIGGALIVQQQHAVLSFDAGGIFSPLAGLYWFGAVVVFGLSYRSGAVLAAVVFVGVDALTNTPPPTGSSLVVIGLFAAAIGYLPGGLIGTALRLVRGDGGAESLSPLQRSLTTYVRDRYAREHRPPPGEGLVPSPLATRLLRPAAGARR